MKPMEEEFIDYSTILMKIEQLEKELHEACLNKEFEKVFPLTNQLVNQANILKLWAKAQK